MRSARESPAGLEAGDDQEATGSVGARAVVLFGSFDENLHPRVRVLRQGLELRGHEITVVNEPLGLTTADKVHAASSLSGSAHLLRAILRSWWKLWRTGCRVAEPELVVVGYMGHFDIHVARLLWRRTTIVLDHMVGLADTAHDRGVAEGLKLRLLRWLDHAALSRADVIVVDTAEQRKEIPLHLRDRAVVVPVGAALEWFQQNRPPLPPPLRVCYVGLYTPLHGTETIGRAIAELAADRRIEFTMIGSGQDFDNTVAAADGGNVTWIDWLDGTQLPDLVASQHVCLGIFGTTTKASRVVPSKAYQGLAAGNLVITSDTPVQRAAFGDTARYVPAGDHKALAGCLRELADDPASYETGAEARRLRSLEFRPDRVVGPLVDRLNHHGGGPSPGVSRPRQSMNGRKTLNRRSNLAHGPALPANAWLRFDLIRGALEGLTPSRILEVGPGQGAVAARLVAAGHEYTGVELADEVRERTGALLRSIPGGRVRMLRSTADLSDDDLFDTVCAFEVLEHIDDDEKALWEWVGHLAPGGVLLLSVPAWPHRYSTHDFEVGHVRRYTPHQLVALAESVGLCEVEVRLYGFPLGFGLEGIRNAMSKRIQKGSPATEESALDRTKRSSGWFQPPSSFNTVIRVGTWPFRLAQRMVTGKGTGLVLMARRPAPGYR